MTRRVIVTEMVRVPADQAGTYKMESHKREANFHQFGNSYIEFESGPGNFSTAIVEYDNGMVDEVAVTAIQFCEPLGGAA